MNKELLQKLEEVGALITDSHFIYTSGLHGSTYFNKDAIYPHTKLTQILCLQIALAFANEDVQAVIAPAIGGVILSQWIANQLTDLTGREVLGVYAEKSGDNFVIKRGYDELISKKRVLVVEDVLTTGGSVKKVVEAVRRLGSFVVGVGVLCNRAELTVQNLANVPQLFSLFSLNLDSWEASECPLCQQGIPINTHLGKG